MKIIIILLILLTLLNAGIFDFWNEKNAKDAYNAKKYNESSSILKSLDKSDIRVYNLANSYYKEGKYTEARKAYDEVKSIDKATVLHNIGNSYFKENNLSEAIKSYEKALAIRTDKDTKFNLDLAKKKKQKSDKQKEKKKEKPPEKPKQEPKDKDKDKQKQQKEPSRENKEQMQQNEQRKKEMRHIMRKLEEKKMPTMIYRANKPERSSSEKNPW